MFLALALLELPVSAGWIDPALPDLGEHSWMLKWLLYDFIPQFFGVAFVAAMAHVVIAARKSEPLNQAVAEMVVSFLAFVFLLPVY